MWRNLFSREKKRDHSKNDTSMDRSQSPVKADAKSVNITKADNKADNKSDVKSVNITNQQIKIAEKAEEEVK